MAPPFVRSRCVGRVLGGGVALVVALAMAPSRAAAQQVPDTEALVLEGLALRGQGRDAEALERFGQAWTQSPSPRVRVQMGWAAQALGRWAEAERWLDEGLTHPDDPWIVRNRDAITASRARVAQHLGSLEVLGPVAGATVEVNGTPAGTLPLPAPLRVAVGSVVVRVTAPGYRPAVRDGVVVRAGALTRETLSLVAVEPPPPPEPPPPAAIPHPPVFVPSPPERVPLPSPLPPRPASPSGRAVGGWITFGAGLTAAAVGAAVLIDRESDVAAYAAGLQQGRCVGALGQDSDPTCLSLRRSAERAQPLGLGFVMGGGVLTGLGLVLALTAPAPRATSTALRCAPTLGLPGLGCTLRF